MIIVGILLCTAITYSTIECWGGNSSPPTQSVACVISVPTNTYRIGDEISLTVHLKNTGTNEVQIAMPESHQGRIEAFFIPGSTTKRIPTASHASVQTNAAYTTLRPMQESHFQLLVSTAVNETAAVAAGAYGLQIEFSYSSSSLYTGGHAHFANDSTAKIEAYERAGVPIVEEKKLWKGRVQSNIVDLTLAADK